MLKSLRIRLICHRQAWINSIKALCDTPLATCMTLMVIAIALTLPSLFWLLGTNIKQLTSGWQQEEHISLYLQVSLNEAQTEDILARVRQTEGVFNAKLISAREGLVQLQGQEGLNDIAEYLSDNPIPAVIDVTPTPLLNTPEKIASLFQQLKAYPHIEQAKLDMQWVARLYAILGFVTVLAKSLMLLLGFAVVMIIGNTLRLAVHKCHEEVQVLKLIGATDAYIARPFLYSGLWFGFIGALVALALMQLFVLSLSSIFHQLLELYHIQYAALSFTWIQAVTLIGVAMCLGWLGARISIKRQIALIEP
jgi:cell division transport system permease protein